ncbi:Nucleotide-binding universal stress protein, UspA family [Actinomadura meyerae]|jgi:nucleotide-binding universal stress UspA family protein|uniref:Nucleotide-binding universal stress protein, UspA family n=1 Tax=Actinomadura meyerae TaxID=240840 RepID=A0A239MBT6_9ACTN|nr:universal stress protein [Actinomadura meyerae]SNT39950.1 Nucleotide-binding universal stress protein, UspA family [Actinomadura meyerae]
MTVLIAFDGSDDARTAIEFAARHVKDEPAVVMTVWEPLLTQITWAPIAAVAPVPAEPKDGDRWEEEKQAEQLARAGADLAAAAGLTDVTTRAERGGGPVWAAIVDVADELDASLIVTGSRGLAGARSVILGSVSTRVLHHAHRPVLVVPPPKKD